MPMVIRLIKFHDGVYLHGRVVQSVAVGSEADVTESGRGMNVQRVEEAHGTDTGLVIKHGGKWFFVPWSCVSSCEIDEPAKASAPTVQPAQQTQQGGRR